MNTYIILSYACYICLVDDAWPCFGLPARSLLSRPGHHRTLFSPLYGTGGGANLSLSPCFPLADPCILCDWPFCVEWTSIGPMAQGLFPRVHSNTFYSSNCSFSPAGIGSASE